MKFALAVILLLYFFCSCAAQASAALPAGVAVQEGLPAGQAGVDSAGFTYDSLIAKIDSNKTDYRTLTVHARMVWDDGNTEQPMQASIRMRRDSLIWMSLTGPVGMEGARVVLTPDSFRMLSRMTSEYLVSNFDYLQNWVYYPVNFGMVQDIISGQRMMIGEKAKMAIYSDSMFLIYAETPKMIEEIWVNTGSYTLAKILLKDKMVSQTLLITFDAYSNLNGKPFAHKRTLDVKRDGISMKLTIDIIKVRVNDAQSYPFEAGEKYKLVNAH